MRENAGVQIVDDDDEHAPLERRAVGDDVGRNRGLREERRIGALDRDVHHREHGQRLRLAVLDDLEVVLGQVADEVALRVGDVGVDLDVVDFDLEGDGGCRRGLGGGRLLRHRRGGEKPTGQQNETDGGIHNGLRRQAGGLDYRLAQSSRLRTNASLGIRAHGSYRLGFPRAMSRHEP